MAAIKFRIGTCTGTGASDLKEAITIAKTEAYQKMTSTTKRQTAAIFTTVGRELKGLAVAEPGAEEAIWVSV